jgi:cell division initiation protein
LEEETMRITPLDVRKQEFRRVVRGLDPEEVSAFLSTVADEYEAVLVDNKQLRERILELDEKIGEYRNMERTLRDTLMTAERVLNETKDNAMKEADLMLRDAELRGQQINDSFRQQALDLRREILSLHQEKEAYLARFRGLAEAQIQFVDHHQTDFEQLDARLMDLVNGLDRPRRPEATASAVSAPTRPASASEPPRSAVPRRMEDDVWRDYAPSPEVTRRRSRLQSLLPQLDANTETASTTELLESAAAVAAELEAQSGPEPPWKEASAGPGEPAPERGERREAPPSEPATPERVAVAAEGKAEDGTASDWDQESFAKRLNQL